jgi:hypothetical protein
MALKLLGSLDLSGGNLGIGTTNPVTGLDVRSTPDGYSNTMARFGNSAPLYLMSSYAAIGFNQYYDNTWKAGSSGYSGQIGLNHYEGDMYFKLSTQSNAADGFVLEETTPLYIKNNGDVGFGITNPQAPLHLYREQAPNFLAMFQSQSPDTWLRMSSSDGTWDVGAAEGNKWMVHQKSGYNTPRLTIDSIGYVGIGTTTPAYNLEVNGTLRSTSITIADYVRHEQDLDTYFGFSAADAFKVIIGNSTRFEIYNSGTFVLGNLWVNEKIGHNGDSNTYMAFPSNDNINWYTSGSERMRISAVGNVGIGISLGSEKLHVNGNILAAGNILATGDITAFSDSRIKENIKTLPNALESVKRMRGVTYNKIGEEKQSIGVIAQEVQSILPELVSENSDGMLSVAYGNITGVLIEAIKEQQKQIEELKAQLDGITK